MNAQARRLSAWDDLMTLCEMGNEEEDESLIPGGGVVVLPGQQGGQPGGLHLPLQGGEACLHLGDEGLVLLLIAHLAQGHQIVPGGQYAMLQFDEYRVKLNNLKPDLDKLGRALDLESAERELDELHAQSAADGFWDNVDKAQKLASQRGGPPEKTPPGGTLGKERAGKPPLSGDFPVDFPGRDYYNARRRARWRW